MLNLLSTGRYDLYQSKTSRGNPTDGIFRSEILWPIVSNAFWRSIKKTRIKTFYQLKKKWKVGRVIFSNSWLKFIIEIN